MKCHLELVERFPFLSKQFKMTIRLAEERDRKELIAMCNDVYYTSEAEFWAEGYYRLDDADYDEFLEKGWLRLMFEGESLVGCIVLKPYGLGASSFSMLVCHPEHRKKGIGSKLVNHVTALSKDRGDKSMYLELLTPKEWIHQEKEFLKTWYGGMGYKLIKEVDFRDYYPDHIKFMKTELVFSLYQLRY